MTYRLHVTGLDSHTCADEFMALVEYARRGRVIVDWRDPDDLELANGFDDGEPFPVFDDTDRSGHARYPLAEMLVTCGCIEIVELDTPGQITLAAVFSFDPVGNMPLIDQAAEQAGMAAHALAMA